MLKTIQNATPVINYTKKNVIIFITGKFDPTSRSLAQQAFALRPLEITHNLFFVVHDDNPENLKFFKEDTGISFIKENTISLDELTNDILKNSKTSAKSYKEYLENSCTVHEFITKFGLEIDKIINWGGCATPLESSIDLLETYNSTKFQNFRPNLTSVLQYFCIHSLITKYPDTSYTELIYDPLFTSYYPDREYFPGSPIIKHYHEHSLLSKKFKRFSGYQYYLLNNEKQPSFESKDIDFVFGMTATTDKRYKLLKRVKSFCQNQEHFYYMTDEKNNEYSNLVEKAEYTSLIQRARYSLILESFHHEAFSVTRLCESVFNRCCPLFIDTCNFEILENDFGIEKDKIKSLIISDKLKFPTEEERTWALDYLHNKLFNHLELEL